MATATRIPESQTPKLTYRSTRQFEMRKADFGSDVNGQINTWLEKQLDLRKRQLDNLHKHKVPEWRRIAAGKPKEETKSWPFPNCSNLVHAIVGELCDELSARVLGLLYATSPLAYFRYYATEKDAELSHKNEEKARVLEQFIDLVGYEPEELDLYRNENLWFAESGKLGTSWLICYPEKRVEAVYVGYKQAESKTEFEEETLYEGPKVGVCRYEDVIFDPDADTPEQSEIVARKIPLTRRQLQERVFRGHYDKEAVESILDKPDRYGPSEIRKRENQKKGIQSTEDNVTAEWDVWESYFYWYKKDKKYRLICWYHLATKTMLNQVFNFIPDNRIPLIRTRLANDTHGMIGTGYAELMKYAQEEISTSKNQRTDAITWGILGINRVSPQNKNIDKNFTVFPGCAAPYGKDEFEHIAVGEPQMVGASMQNETMMIQQARERAGVGPAIAGTGTGSFNKKGQYGSMGTLAVMQDNNSRVNHRLSDFRHAHVKAVGLLTAMYGAMGLGRRGSAFGLDDALLSEALQDYLEHRVRIPIRAATASANKEVEKQNDILLSQALRAHHTSISQLLQAVGNAGIPPEAKEFFSNVIKAQNFMFMRLLRNFGYDQPEQFLPVPKVGNDAQNQAQPDPRILQMASQLHQRGGVAAPGGLSGMESDRGGLPGSGGEPGLQGGA